MNDENHKALNSHISIYTWLFNLYHLQRGYVYPKVKISTPRWIYLTIIQISIIKIIYCIILFLTVWLLQVIHVENTLYTQKRLCLLANVMIIMINNDPVFLNKNE